jgi:hypothetical protein
MPSICQQSSACAVTQFLQFSEMLVTSTRTHGVTSQKTSQSSQTVHEHLKHDEYFVQYRFQIPLRLSQINLDCEWSLYFHAWFLHCFRVRCICTIKGGAGVCLSALASTTCKTNQIGAWNFDKSVRMNFTFSIACITIRLLQSEPTNTHNCVKVTILQHISSYMSHWLIIMENTFIQNSCLMFAACSNCLVQLCAL